MSRRDVLSLDIDEFETNMPYTISSDVRLIDPRRFDTLMVKKLYHDAILPTKANDGDLGYDLFAIEDVQIPGGLPTKVHTGIACQFPCGYGAFIKDRSGIASRNPLHVTSGVIDNGYTGEIVVVVANYSSWMKEIHAGDKFAQMVLIPVVDFSVREVTEIESSDGRGAMGFGSTGK